MDGAVHLSGSPGFVLVSSANSRVFPLTISVDEESVLNPHETNV